MYKKRDTAAAEALIKKTEELGYKAIFLTVDAPVAGNRERDIRVPFAEEDAERADAEGEGVTQGEMPRRKEDYEIDDNEDNEVGGTAGALLKNDDLDLSWSEVGFVKKQPEESHPDPPILDDPVVTENIETADRNQG